MRFFFFLYGNKEYPQKGFSARALEILEACNVDFLALDISETEDIREAIKSISAWPMFPQLYISGEFIGGSDLLPEMYKSGELQRLLLRIRGM